MSRHRNPIPVPISHTHMHTHLCVLHRKRKKKEEAAQGNGYVDDEQKLRPINHFDLFCSFFRLKLILMPESVRDIAWGRGGGKERERGKEGERESKRVREIVVAARIMRAAAHKNMKAKKMRMHKRQPGNRLRIRNQNFDSFPLYCAHCAVFSPPLVLALRARPD